MSLTAQTVDRGDVIVILGFIYINIYININVLDRAALCCMTEWTSRAAQQQQHRCNKYRDTE